MFKHLVRLMFLVAVGSTVVTQGQTIEPVQKRVETSLAKLKASDANQHFQALAELGDLGPLAKTAVPTLIETLKSTEDIALQHEVLITLERIGTEASEAIPAIAEFLKNQSPVLQHQALHTLRQMGPKAKDVVPQIETLLNARSPVLRTAAAWALASISNTAEVQREAIPILITGLKSEDPGVLSDAVTGLAAIGQPAVASLEKLLSDRSATLAMHAADALALMGPAASSAIGALVKALDRQDEIVVAHAAQALGIISSNPESVVPALTEKLDSESAMVQIAAASALGNFGDAADEAVGELAKLLSHEAVEVRIAAARALGAIGPEAKAAVPALDKALDDSAGIVTLTAFEALGAIKGPAVDVLSKRLDDPAFLPLAAAVLGQMEAEAAPATEALVKHLTSTEDPQAQLEILVALGSIGPDAKAAVKPLLELVKTGKDQMRRGAVYALAKIGAKEAIPVLQETVTDTSDPLLQRTSAWALVMLEPEKDEYIKQALPRLVTGLSDEMPLVRKEVAIAIQKLGPKAAEAVPALVKALPTSEPEVQVEVLDALAQIGPDAKVALPEAVKLLNSQDPQVKYTAIYLLGKMGEASKDAAAALEKILDGQDEFGQAVAAWALVNIDPTSEHKRRAVPLMIKALGHDVPGVRSHAAEMLGKIGAGNPQVVEALKKAAQDEDETVRKAAEKALSELK